MGVDVANSMKLVVTNAGRDALKNAAGNGTNALMIESVVLGNGRYTPDPGQSWIREEHHRLKTIAGTVTGSRSLHVTVRDESRERYSVFELGLVTSTGVLFAVYSQNDVIIEKAPGSTLLLSLDIELKDIDVKQIAFGDTSFINPAASTDIQGVVELATDDEARAGVDSIRAITPVSLHCVINDKLNKLGSASSKNIEYFELNGEAEKAKEDAIKASTLRDSSRRVGFVNDDKLNPYIEYFSPAGAEIISVARSAWVSEIQTSFDNFKKSLGNASKRNVSVAAWDKMPEKGSLLTTESQMYGLYANTIKSDFALAHGFINSDKARPYTRHADGTVVETATAEALKNLANGMGSAAKRDVSKAPWNGMPEKGSLLTTESQMFGLYANTIKSDYALAHGFIDGDKKRPYTRHADDSVVEVTPRSALKDGAYHDVSRVKINDAKEGSEALATESHIADIASNYQRSITIGVDGGWGRITYPGGFVEMWGEFGIGDQTDAYSEYQVRFPSSLKNAPSNVTLTVDCNGFASAKKRNSTEKGFSLGIRVIDSPCRFLSVQWSVRGYLA